MPPGSRKEHLSRDLQGNDLPAAPAIVKLILQ